MRLTVLGSGSCELKAERSSSSYLVEAGGMTLVLDLGQGAWRRFLDAGHEAVQLDAVLISHHHLDHFADVLPLLFALNYDPVLSVDGKVTLVGDLSLQPVFAGMAEVFGDWVQPPPEVYASLFVEPGAKFSIGTITVQTERAAHIGSSLAYRLECDGTSLVYLGDSAPDDALVDLARDADVLIAHSVAPDNEPVAMHMGPRQAGDLAARAGVHTLVLSHFYRRSDPLEAVASAGSRFDGRIVAAEDGLVLEIDSPDLR